MEQAGELRKMVNVIGEDNVTGLVKKTSTSFTVSQHFMFSSDDKSQQEKVKCTEESRSSGSSTKNQWTRAFITISHQFIIQLSIRIERLV